jgi:hypothetical protein
MAVTIEATKGAADANSYATVQEADTFFNGIYGAEEWFAVDEDDKARLLITATKMLENLPLNYAKLADTQALKFPVDTGLATNDGWTAIKEACYWQALYILRNGETLKEALAGTIQGVKSTSVSGFSQALTGFNYLKKWHPSVLRLLGAYTNFEFKFQRHS